MAGKAHGQHPYDLHAEASPVEPTRDGNVVQMLTTAVSRFASGACSATETVRTRFGREVSEQ
ncbi:hypothetical protein [Jannaschia sp. AI_61]|uniref:hypothetical protein n=1 Tax=Jannaschia sp. AI_61 TaxID=2829796 RepID=UPI001C7D4EEB|nr:hypothetical protein [Jannaschia sp. AI_61]